MAGIVIKVVSQRVIDFAGLGLNIDCELILADRIDLTGWREATTQLKVHSVAIGVGAGTIKVLTIPQSVSSQDPGLEFLDRSRVTTFLLDSSTPTPDYQTLFTYPMPMSRIVVVGNRTGAGNLRATLSIDLAVKDDWILPTALRG